MIGKRVDEKEGDDNQWPYPILQAGEYGKGLDGGWHCVPPGTNLLGNLGAHTIEEHGDGTITVTPSILITGHDATYHGFLTKGEWREC